jgi:hypothetical protein
MTTVQNSVLFGMRHAVIAISACVVMTVVSPSARATTGYPSGASLEVRTRQICERIMRVAPGEAAFAECIDSLADALHASGQSIALKPITVAGSEEDDGLPYYANSIGMRFYRDQRACTQLGLAARAETNCVMNLAAAMEDFENPIN